MENIQSLIATLPVQDQDRADKFYKEVLGFESSEKNMPGGTVLSSPDGSEIFLYMTEASSGDATRLSLSVSDFDAFVKVLAEHSIELESYDGMPGETDQKGVYNFEGANVAWFKDTEGNIVNIFSA